MTNRSNTHFTLILYDTSKTRHLPIGVGVVVHKPGAVVVHIHGPGFVVLPQHHLFHGVDPCHTKCRVWVVVIAIDANLPVVNALRFEGK